MTSQSTTLPSYTPQPHGFSRIALCLCLLLLCHSSESAPVLKQVHVITRHGSRSPLSKDAMTLEEETSEKSILTPNGQQQHYQLGEWLRERYAPNFGAVLDEYSPTQVHMESSAYERTLVSANSLALGLFPTPTRGLQLIPETPPVIPVYTHARHNDITIRAYDKCPAFHDRLEQLYLTNTWNVMEVDSMPLLQRLAKIPAFGQWIQRAAAESYIPLKDIWNIYDAIHVAKTECPTPNASHVCKDLPDPTLATAINDNDWVEIQMLAHAVEWLKYGRDIAQNYLGGALWNSIFNRVLSSTKDSQLFLTSAHYPTLLGLFAALDISITSKEEFVIPEYASALILEVYQDDASSRKRSVQMLYKSGSKVQANPIQFADKCPADDPCPLETLEQVLKPKLLAPQEWCKACQNTQADVCAQQQLEALQGSCPSGDSNNSTTLAALFFAGMLTMAMIFMIATTFCSRRRVYHGDNNNNINNNTTKSANHLSVDLTDVKPPSMEDSLTPHVNGNGLPHMNGAERPIDTSDGFMT